MERDVASAAAAALCVQSGANIVRTHNVAFTRDAVRENNLSSCCSIGQCCMRTTTKPVSPTWNGNNQAGITRTNSRFNLPRLLVVQVSVAHAVGRAANPANDPAPPEPLPVEPNPTPGVQEAVV